MSNNLRNFNNVPSMPERILSALAYFTLGTVGIILLVASVLLKVNLKPFVKLNVYQSILLGFVFAFLQITYLLLSSILQFFSMIPVLNYISSFCYMVLDFIMGIPMFFGFSLLAIVIILLILYLALTTLLGKMPYIPYLSNCIKRLV